MSKDIRVIRKEGCDIWNNLKDKTKMIDYLIESKVEAAKLEVKLAEKDKEIKEWQTMYEGVTRTCANDYKEILRLRGELLEKEKEIEKVKEVNLDVVKKQIEFYKDQDKISFCIEKLEKVSQEFSMRVGITDNNMDLLNEIIDKQINELKEMK